MRRTLSTLLVIAAGWGSAGVEHAWAREPAKARAAKAQPAKAAQPAAAEAPPAPPGADNAPAPAPTPPSAAQQQLERLRALKAELEASEQRNAGSEPQREVTASSRLEVGTRYRRELVEAATTNSVKPLDGTPEQQAALRALLGAELSAQAKALPLELQEHTRNMVARSEELAHAKPEAAAELTIRRNRSYNATVTLLGEANEILAARASLGDDVAAQKRELQGLLGDNARWASNTLQGTSRELARLEQSAGSKPSAEEKARIDALQEDLSSLANAERKVVELMDEHGLDTVQLRRELISATGKVSQDILDARVLSGLYGEWRSNVARWFAENASALVFRVLSCLLVVAVFMALARLARSLTRRALTRAKGGLSTLASSFLIAGAGRVIWVIGLVIAAAQLGIEVAPLIAGLGIAGFVAGFALQDTLSNFASGLMILLYRPFDVGDMIEAGGATGSVLSLTLVYTSVLTPDNQMLIIPNNKIWGGVIRNVTNQASRRIDLEFRVSYADDIDRAESLLASILRDSPRVLAEPAPVVRLHELGDSCAKFVVRPWVKTSDYWDAYWEITREVKRRFDAEGFTIPFPQQDLRIRGDALSERVRRDSEIAPSMAASGERLSG